MEVLDEDGALGQLWRVLEVSSWEQDLEIQSGIRSKKKSAGTRDGPESPQLLRETGAEPKRSEGGTSLSLPRGDGACNRRRWALRIGSPRNKEANPSSRSAGLGLGHWGRERAKRPIGGRRSHYSHLEAGAGGKSVREKSPAFSGAGCHGGAQVSCPCLVFSGYRTGKLPRSL